MSVRHLNVAIDVDTNFDDPFEAIRDLVNTLVPEHVNRWRIVNAEWIDPAS